MPTQDQLGLITTWDRFIEAKNPPVALTSNITASSTSLTINCRMATKGCPNIPSYAVIKIDDEFIYTCSKSLGTSTTTLTVCTGGRGYWGTRAAPHTTTSTVNLEWRTLGDVLSGHTYPNLWVNALAMYYDVSGSLGTGLEAYQIVVGMGSGMELRSTDQRYALVPRTVSTIIDNTPPALNALTLSPLSISTGTGTAEISGTITASDVGVGLRNAVVALFSPSGQQRVDCVTAILPAATASASMPCSGVFPQYSEGGTWEVRFVEVSDHAGNTRSVIKEVLAQMGAPVTVNVSGGAPTFLPASLDFQFVIGRAAPMAKHVLFLGSNRPWTLEKQNGSSWVQLSQISGSAPALVEVSVNPSGLPYGIYQELLLVREVISNIVIARLPVTLSVLSAPLPTSSYFEPPLFDTVLTAVPSSGEIPAVLVYIYWPEPP